MTQFYLLPTQIRKNTRSPWQELQQFASAEVNFNDWALHKTKEKKKNPNTDINQY